MGLKQTTMGLRQFVKLLLTAFQIVGNRPCFGHAAGYSRFFKKRKSVFDGAEKNIQKIFCPSETRVWRIEKGDPRFEAWIA
jgi:hypothetical protein